MPWKRGKCGTTYCHQTASSGCSTSFIIPKTQKLYGFFVSVFTLIKVIDLFNNKAKKNPFNPYIILFSSSRTFRLQIGCHAFPGRRHVRYLLISMITNAKEAEESILSVGVRNSFTKFSRHRMQNKGRADKICRCFISPSDAPATFK